MIKFKDLLESDILCPMELVGEVEISDNLKYHLQKNIPLSENIFRTYSESYFELINEVRKLYYENKIELCDPDAELVESDLGVKVMVEGREIYLDETSRRLKLTYMHYKGKARIMAKQVSYESYPNLAKGGILA